MIFPRYFAVFSATLSLFGAAGCAPVHGEAPKIPEASQRLVLTPSALAVLSDSQATQGAPGAVAFGDASGPSALYLDFSKDWQRLGVPLAAFLALDAREGAVLDKTPITIEVWSVRSAWQPSELRAWSDKPTLAPPFARITLSTSASQPLRVDVTPLLRFMVQNPTLDHGFALLARSGTGHGASFATGMSGGRAPRLEIYVR